MLLRCQDRLGGEKTRRGTEMTLTVFSVCQLKELIWRVYSLFSTHLSNVLYYKINLAALDKIR